MKLVASALRLQNGRIFTGKRHPDARTKAYESNVDRLEVIKAEQGFVSEDGSFFTREAALEMLLETKQITLPLIGSVLTSEDLW